MTTDITTTLRNALLLVENHAQLAKAARVHRLLIWKFASGRGGISLTTAARLCAAMGLDLRRVRQRADSDSVRARTSGKRREVSGK